MKRFAILAVVVLAILAVTSVALAENGPKFGVTNSGTTVYSQAVQR